MDKTERVRAALRGEAVDRPPYGFWTHFPGTDLDPDRLAEATARFAREFDLDFVKSMPNGLYCVEDWGCVCDYGEVAKGGVAKVVSYAITEPGNWGCLRRLDVTAGAFGRELKHLKQVIDLVGDETPVLATAFSPLTIAQKLSGGAHRAHMQTAPGLLKQGLEMITAVTVEFVHQALGLGCAGVFFATQEASLDNMDEASYAAFGRPFDAPVLAAMAAGGWFNVLHMHGDNVMFDLLKDYDVSALNWHVGETPPSIRDYRKGGGGKPIVGGLQRTHITNKNQEAVLADLRRTLDETGGRGILISPACVIRHPVDSATLTATAEAIKRLA